ncbi:MAG: hypothetical protein A3F10_02040 [Coxiella sp. RIFCSPHIGHO2_12_FULL_42_15]|nr:MAG: hypothetical protein A3F10_02040 [Coxiella sp. RIFCSPHIGHO2_12_FULL_42_15]
MENMTPWLQQTLRAYPHLSKEKLDQTLQCIVKLTEKNTALDLNQGLDRGIEISKHLLPLECDTQTICVALLYPFFTKEEFCRDLIQQKLDVKIYKMLQGVQRMETIDHLPIKKDKVVFSTKQLDHLRRMLLAIVDDVRIVLVKLAERLTTLIELRQKSQETQQSTAKQIMALYAPLANRLGIGQIKWQLEDGAFRYLDPINYSAISKELNQRRQDREKYIHTVQQELETLLNHSHIEKYEISGRAKHIYSIYRKAKRKELPFEQVYDSNAFRILVPNIEGCYRTLSLIHEKWKHIKHEFDDYIAKPKSNGYKSIHTIVLGPHDRFVEIQIRTFTMHEEAELGVAAHWKYKEGQKTGDQYENKIALLRDVIRWQQELTEDNQERSHLYSQLFEDRIYVFTPTNDILDLPVGSTPLDAAYYIHTDIGHRCRGAKINHKIVPLTHPLKTGDVIEILTSKENKPSRDWLNPDRGYLMTKAAYNKVRNWFSRQFREEKLIKGQEIWDKLAKRENFTKNDLTELVPIFNFKTIDDLLVAIGSGNIGTHAITRQLKPDIAVSKSELTIDKDYPAKPAERTEITISGAENLLTQLARCCQPIPGDAIAGYITKGRGVSIHRQHCHNLQQAMKIRPERILEVNWGGKTPSKYPINLEIDGIDHPTLIRDISSIIANEHLSLLGIHSRLDARQGRCHIKLTVELSDLSSLHNVMQQLRGLPHVTHVTRT